MWTESILPKFYSDIKTKVVAQGHTNSYKVIKKKRPFKRTIDKRLDLELYKMEIQVANNK